jgi:maltose alpha-D-glucosyltransferase/alpha-amylase
MEPSLLDQQKAPAGAVTGGPLAVLPTPGSWVDCLEGECRGKLEEAIGQLLPHRRWFGGKAKTLRTVQVQEAIPLDGARLLLVNVEYTDAEAETYALPVAFVPDTQPELRDRLLQATPPVVIARVESDAPEGTGLLYDPLADPGFGRLLLGAVESGVRFRGSRGDLVGTAAPIFSELKGPELRGAGDLEPALLGAEQSNTSLRFGDRLVLKVFRRLEEGINPDLEIGRYLTERTTFRNSPRVAGSLEILRRERGAEPMTLGILQELVPNEGDAWRYTLDALGRYFERALTGWGRGEHGAAVLPQVPLVELAEQARLIPPDDFERLGTYLPNIRLLGERTAELHIALAAGEGKDFAPEPFSELYQRSLFDSMRKQAERSFRLLTRRLDTLAPADREKAERLLAAEGEVVDRFRRLVGHKIAAERIRTHGDYHLGQVLFTGKDFVILDFEGEPARSLSERRLKRSPLRDVAGMLRSFHYAAYARLFEETAAGVVTGPEVFAELETWAQYWERWISAAFLRSYLDRAPGASFLPASREELAILLDVYLLEKAVYELQYELNNRPAWVGIPLQGIQQILGASPGA